MKKENYIICPDCVRGDFKSLRHKEEKGEWPKSKQRYGHWNSYDPTFKYKGCITCGGYGYLAVREDCPSCGKEIWHRPDPITVYAGKKVGTYKGVTIVYTGRTWVCEKCMEDVE